jgi:hypothetical protein
MISDSDILKLGLQGFCRWNWDYGNLKIRILDSVAPPPFRPPNKQTPLKLHSDWHIYEFFTIRATMREYSPVTYYNVYNVAYSSVKIIRQAYN